MSPEERIRQIAAEAAARAHQRQAGLERDKLDLETELAEKQAELDAAHLAGKRLADFPVKLGADFICPHCWIGNGRSSPLKQSSETRTTDFFDCGTCGCRVEVFIGMP